MWDQGGLENFEGSLYVVKILSPGKFQSFAKSQPFMTTHDQNFMGDTLGSHDL